MSSDSRIAVARDHSAEVPLNPPERVSESVPVRGLPARQTPRFLPARPTARLLLGSVTHLRLASSAELLVSPGVTAPHGRAPRPPLELPTIWESAIRADTRAAREYPLEDLWQDHVNGRLSALWEHTTADRALLISKLRGGAKAVSSATAESSTATTLRAEAPDAAPESEARSLTSGSMLRVPSLVARVLIGEQQKFVACELQVTPSTVSGRYVRGLEDMGLSHDCIPLSIILAAQVWAGVVIVPAARRAFFEHEGQVYVVVSIARPATERMLKLSLAERHVAKCLIEGNARDAIAGLRRTSNHTVARQIHSIFEKERATGRFALVRRAAEQGCFG